MRVNSRSELGVLLNKLYRLKGRQIRIKFDGCILKRKFTHCSLRPAFAKKLEKCGAATKCPLARAAIVVAKFLTKINF